MPYRIKYKGEQFMGATPAKKSTAIKVQGVAYNFYCFRYFDNQMVDGSYFVSDSFFERIKDKVADKMAWEVEEYKGKKTPVRMFA